VKAGSLPLGAYGSLPECQSPNHRVWIRKHAFRYHVTNTVPKRIVPFCSDCIAMAPGVKTSPWTAALLEEYYVQEIMES
jgi:hypothetical protein